MKYLPAILGLVAVVLTSGCVAGGPSVKVGVDSFLFTPDLTIVLTNNTTVPLQVFQNGSPLYLKVKGTKEKNLLVVPSGGVLRRSYYVSGRGEVELTVRGLCSEANRSGECFSGYVGMASKNFYIGRGYHRVDVDYWEVSRLNKPRKY